MNQKPYSERRSYGRYRRRGSAARNALHRLMQPAPPADPAAAPPGDPAAAPAAAPSGHLALAATGARLGIASLLLLRTVAAALRAGNVRELLAVVPSRLVLHSLVLLLAVVLLVGEGGLAWSRTVAYAPLEAMQRLAQQQAAEENQPPPGADELVAPVVLLPTSMPAQGAANAAEAPTLEQVSPDVRGVAVDDAPVFQQVHQLAAGESLGQIAARYGITLETLIWANQLYTGDVLMVGQDLRIPRLSGLPYTIQAGDTLDSIAQRFGVVAEQIADFHPNRVRLDGPLPVGREIFIPGGSRPLPDVLLALRGGREGLATSTPQSAGVVRDWRTNLREGPGTDYEKLEQFSQGRRAQLLGKHEDWVQVDIAGTRGWMLASLLDIPVGTLEQVPATSDFPPPPPIWVWPTYGAFTSGFGPRWGGFHQGIDIANRAWTPIVAARAGQVTQAGWCSGYGYCVRIRHPGGIETVYGHLIAQPPVSVGTEVKVETVIGYMGSTYDARGGGYSTGNHLHFEIRVNGVAVNPLRFLP